MLGTLGQLSRILRLSPIAEKLADGDGVAVGGIGVAVGGIGVAVWRDGVTVGGIGVAV